MIAQLSEGCDTATAEVLTSHQRKVDPNRRKLLEMRKGLMKDLSKRNLDLQTYLIAIGANTLKYQPNIQTDHDPLADIEEFDENDNDETILDDAIPTYAPRTTTNSNSRPTVSRQKKSTKTKGKRQKQKPVPESEESFIHVESIANEIPFASIGGDELKEARRQNEDSSSSLLTSAVLASAGLSVLSRFTSRASASRSSPRKSPASRSLARRPNPPVSPSPTRSPIPSSRRAAVAREQSPFLCSAKSCTSRILVFILSTFY